MKVLIVSQYFWPENFRINEIALSLKERGHEVTVLTGLPNYPQGRFYNGYGFFGPFTETFRGIRLIRAPLISRGRHPLRLFLNYLSFTFCSSLYAALFALKKFDIIFVFEVSPVFIGIPALVYKALRKTPVLFWVLDLWPESLISSAAVKSGAVLGLTEKIVRFIYRHSDEILISSKGFKKSITEKGIPDSKITYFPNMVESVYFSDSPKASAFPFIPGFKVMFAGNIGVSQDFPSILSACELAREFPGIQWLIVGEGRMSQWVKKEIQERGLKNIHLLGSFPQEAMPGILSRADALLVTLKKSSNFDLTVPGKIQSYMASGKPILAMMDGEGGRLIVEAGCGFAGGAEDSQTLFQNAVRIAALSPEERKLMGEKGKKYSLENFEQNLLIDRLEKIMKNHINPQGNS